jgi:hypothetical protein
MIWAEPTAEGRKYGLVFEYRGSGVADPRRAVIAHIVEAEDRGDDAPPFRERVFALAVTSEQDQFDRRYGRLLAFRRAVVRLPDVEGRRALGAAFMRTVRMPRPDAPRPRRRRAGATRYGVVCAD